MMALSKLHLYGPLAERYGEDHEIPLGVTILDAVRIVECNYPGFLMEVRKGRFHIAVGDGRVGFDNDNGEVVELCGSKAKEVYQHQLCVPRSTGEWHLIPALTGEKSRTAKTIFSIVVGGALLATGIGGALGAAALPGTGASLGLGFGLGQTAFLGLSYGTVALMGAGFLLGGLNMLMTPTPKTNTADKKPTSFAFDGPGEIDDEGGPVPILVGEAIIGGVRIASAITSEGAGSNGGANKDGPVVTPIGGSTSGSGDGSGTGSGNGSVNFHEYLETGSAGSSGPAEARVMNF
jgi:predicted phage tail protein